MIGFNETAGIGDRLGCECRLLVIGMVVFEDLLIGLVVFEDFLIGLVIFQDLLIGWVLY